MSQKVEETLNPSNDELRKVMSRVISRSGIRKVYDVQKIIGKGSYGVVHQAVDRKFNNIVKAVKSVPKIGNQVQSSPSVIPLRNTA